MKIPAETSVTVYSSQVSGEGRYLVKCVISFSDIKILSSKEKRSDIKKE